MKRQTVNKLTKQGTPRTAALKAAGLASASYYYHPASKRKPRVLDDELVAAINAVRQGHNEVYGYRKITRALRAKEIKVNGKKVLRHLRALGLTQPRKTKGQRWTHPVLVKPQSPNTYWEADFTYVWTGQGNAYLWRSLTPGTAISWAMSSPTAAARWRRRRHWRWPCSTASGARYRSGTRLP